MTGPPSATCRPPVTDRQPSRPALPATCTRPTAASSIAQAPWIGARQACAERTFSRVIVPSDRLKAAEQADAANVGREGTPVPSPVNAGGSTPNDSLIDETVREGARRIPAAAPEAEANNVRC